MRKFFKIFFPLLFFTICLYGGILLGKQTVNPKDSASPENSPITDYQSPNQMKLIVFFVDEIEQKNPTLQSVWSVNLYYNEPHQVSFIPLTDPSQPDFKKLSRHFLINEHNALAPAALRSYEKNFLTSWDSSIILDQDAVVYFFSWLTAHQISATWGDLETTTEFQNLWQLCTFLNEKTTSVPGSIDWQVVTQKDFITSLSIHDLFQGLQTFTGDTPPNCKIINTGD